MMRSSSSKVAFPASTASAKWGNSFFSQHGTQSSSPDCSPCLKPGACGAYSLVGMEDGGANRDTVVPNPNAAAFAVGINLADFHFASVEFSFAGCAPV